MVRRNDERNNDPNQDSAVKKVGKMQVNPGTIVKTQEGTDIKNRKRLPFIN